MCFLTYVGLAPVGAVPAMLATGPVAARLTEPAIVDDNEAAVLPMRSGTVLVIVTDVPMPLDMLFDDAAQRGEWPGVQTVSATWSSHIIVTMMEGAVSLAQSRDMAADVLLVASTLASATKASGAGWAGSGLFFPAASFIELCTRHSLPINILLRNIWHTEPAVPKPDTGVQTSGRLGHRVLDGGLPRPKWKVGLRTHGMALFSLPEIQSPPGDEEPHVVLDRVLDLADYLISNGPVIKDGNTTGIDEHRQFRVRHEEDDDGQIVLVLRPVED